MNFRHWRLAIVAIGIVVLGMAVSAKSKPQEQKAQSPETPLPSFEVASVKHSKDAENGRGVPVRIGGPDVSRYIASNATAKMLIDRAYDMKDFQVTGGPGWINSERFDVDAKVEDALVEELKKLPRDQQQRQMSAMLRSLLADRFKLRLTKSTKELPIYALVVAKGGSKLVKAEDSPPDSQGKGAAPPDRGSGNRPALQPGMIRIETNDSQMILTVKAGEISALASLLSQQMGRQVVDRTGLTGPYDYSLKWTPDRTSFFPGGPAPMTGGEGNGVDTGGSLIFTALQEQLGLKLESTKGPVDTITIDSIEEPSEN